MTRMKRTALMAGLAAVLLAGVAFAATPGTYEGWLYKSNGDRWTGTMTTLTVNDAGDRFRLSVYNMRLSCPYLDRNGDPAKARFRFVQRGVVNGETIDATADFPTGSPTHKVRVTGQFIGRRFVGRIRVSAAPNVAGACTGSAHVRARR